VKLHLNDDNDDAVGDCTPLLLAAANHRYAEMRTILRSAAGDADVDRPDGQGRTALHWICKVNEHLSPECCS